MRMRKLGKGQSVVLCGSMEVQRKIIQSSGKTGEKIQVGDVLEWCVANTCTYTGKIIPLWATQGIRHQHRRAVYSNSGNNTNISKALLEPEAQSIEQRYGQIGSKEKNYFLRSVNPQASRSRIKQLSEIRDVCDEFEVTSFATAALQEEQERELSPE